MAGGNITGIKEGSATITATAGNQKAVCTVSVTQAPFVYYEGYVCVPDFGVMFEMERASDHSKNSEISVFYRYKGSYLNAKRAIGMYVNILKECGFTAFYTESDYKDVLTCSCENKKRGVYVLIGANSYYETDGYVSILIDVSNLEN